MEWEIWKTTGRDCESPCEQRKGLKSLVCSPMTLADDPCFRRLAREAGSDRDVRIP
jgi:hypothetical protein